MRAAPVLAGTEPHYKDEILDRLAASYNVAQFVSFSPGQSPTPRFRRIVEFGDETQSPAALVEALLSRSQGSVNVRSFHPEEPKSREFIYGLTKVEAVLSAVSRLAANGLHTIVNETVDVNDGGVSGVSYGGIMEFAPDDTPRCVEKPGVASLKLKDALRLFRIVYAVDLAASLFPRDVRLEFSIHPIKRGVKKEHLIVWEAENLGESHLSATPSWPNRFSQLVGDKTFGLLTAHLIGLPVPFTTVLSRRLAPFSFGEDTGQSETWFRTAPPRPVPGRYTTQKGWTDPEPIWKAEKPAAILAQRAVDAQYAGALLMDYERNIVVEGGVGTGDDFMLGEAPPVDLPSIVHDGVVDLATSAAERLGPVRMEWGFDGDRFWVFQLHRGAVSSDGITIVPGNAREFHRFETSAGIAALRALIQAIAGTDDGIVLVGDVGVTSHLGDILRKASVPSRIERPGSET